MKMDMVRALSVVAVVVCVVAVAGCRQKGESDPTGTAGVAETTGAAVDSAAEKTMDAGAAVVDKTADAAKATAAAAKDMTGKVVEKTGEALERAGAAVEGAGTDMQK